MPKMSGVGDSLMPNGAEVWDPVIKRLKGYVTAVRAGRNEHQAFNAAGETLGFGTQAECMAMLDTPAAREVALDEVARRNREQRT